MRVFSAGKWLDGFLPYHRGADDVRIRVTRWLTLAPVQGLYFERTASLRMVLNYLRELGPRQIWRKARSRSGEGLRNRKYLSIGCGTIVEGAAEVPCLFIAPMHPEGLDEVVLPRAAVRAIAAQADGDGIVVTGLAGEAIPDALRRLEGWSPYAGIEVSAEAWEAALAAAAALLKVDIAGEAAAPPQAVASPAPQAPRADGKGVRAALYGYGNYAKLYVIPNIGSGIDLVRISEIDPTQIPMKRPAQPSWDTAPVPAPDDDLDVYFVAGYHHTHQPIAAFAASRGATAVVEKPIAMDETQLDDLLAALRAGDGRLYCCYNKRFSKLTDWALADLPAGAPVDYHCVVYEVPLPQRHWYRWPHSHSRILSNGCHWIDQFLFFNGFAQPVAIDGFVSPSGTVNCSIQLENGATFSMVLTEHGSERLGVRDHIELRAEGVTIRMTDSTNYHAESSIKVLRAGRVNKADSYRRMYQTISERILSGNPGDSLLSIERSARTIIDTERHLLATPGGEALRPTISLGAVDYD